MRCGNVILVQFADVPHPDQIRPALDGGELPSDLAFHA
jgi:hypothetical protein